MFDELPQWKRMAVRTTSLSDLPDNVVDEILCRLPIKDAARTSVLSRCWRRRWLSIPVLDLSDLYFPQVSQIVPLHSGPLRLFKAEEIDKEGWLGVSGWESSDVERWLTTLSLHSDSSLRTLCLGLNYLTSDLELIDRCFPLLTHLELSGFLSVPLQFQGFTCLRGLHLHEFAPRIDDDMDVLSRLISRCPLLETLDVFNLNCDCVPDLSLDIVAPNLRQLKLNGLDLCDFTITRAPLIEIVHMDSFYPFGTEEDDNGGGGTVGVGCPLMKVLGGIVTVKKLELDHSILEFFGRGNVPERIPIYFNNLRSVSVDANFGDEKPMLLFRCLLRSCTNLRELVMGGLYCPLSTEVDRDVWDVEAQEDVHLFDKLETMTMDRIMCTRHELGFIKFVLARAQALETVKISFHEQVENDFSLAANLLEFPRISHQARILLTRW